MPGTQTIEVAEKHLHYIGLSGETVSHELYDSVLAQRDRAERNVDVLNHQLGKLTQALHNITTPIAARAAEVQSARKSLPLDAPGSSPCKEQPVVAKPTKPVIEIDL